MNCLTRLARSQRRPLAEGCQAGCNPGSVMLTSQERFTLWAFPHWRLACGATVHPSNGVTVSRSMLACCACGSQLANRSLCDRFLARVNDTGSYLRCIIPASRLLLPAGTNVERWFWHRGPQSCVRCAPRDDWTAEPPSANAAFPSVWRRHIHLFGDVIY